MTESQPPSISISAVPNIPLVKPGDDLTQLILDGLASAGLSLADGDILVVAQKVVSKAEGRMVNLKTVTPSRQALQVAAVTQKDPRLVEVILNESNRIERTRPGLLIVEQRLGLVCANAGVDRSNVAPGDDAEWVAKLPADPDASARRIRDALRQRTGKSVAVIVNDTHGRAFRNGAIGIAIGVAGLPALEDLRGHADLFGYILQYTQIALADQIASAASLLQGQADEGRPVILLRGVPHSPGEGSGKDLVRPIEQDLFRQLATGSRA